MSLNRIIISGGGTGGHIFPAIAIANAVKNIYPASEILFVGALGKMEMQKVPLAGYKIIGLNISGIQRKLSLSNLILPFKLIGAFYQANKIIRQFKPEAVVGVGGYASAAMVFMAGIKKIPVLIQEQNSFPGKTNMFLSRFASKICVAYPEMKKYFPEQKISLTGNPVRQEIEYSSVTRNEAVDFFGLDHTKKILFVFGGSQGAKSINEGVENALPLFKDNNVQVIWQTGESYYQRAVDAISKQELNNIRAFAFIEKMDMAYAAADLVVSRSGAMAIAEICIAGKPSVLIPFPFAAEDHQTKNAEVLVSNHAAILIKNHDAPTLLGETALSLLIDETTCENMVKSAKELAHYKSAQSIVKQLESIVQ